MSIVASFQASSEESRTQQPGTSMLQLYNLQDEINKIKFYYEVQQEMAHTMALILHCLNVQSTDPIHKNQRIPQEKYTQIVNKNLSVPAPLSLFLFHHNYLLEMHDIIIHQIKTRKIKNKEQFMDQIFQQIFHSPRIPSLFQQPSQYNTLETHIETLYELYQQLLYLLKPKYD